jgi:hypothetical protein
MQSKAFFAASVNYLKDTKKKSYFPVLSNNKLKLKMSKNALI